MCLILLMSLAYILHAENISILCYLSSKMAAMSDLDV